MPMIFRTLYCCGLRVSEATRLQCEDVDLSEGIITVREYKFDKTRYVPLSENMPINILLAPVLIFFGRLMTGRYLFRIQG